MSKQTNTIKQKDVIIWVNIAFIGMSVLLLFYYIMEANSITSKSYKVQILRDKIESLAEDNGVLMSKKLTLEAPGAIEDFAKLNGLVAAKNISYIFENKNVAQR